MSTWMSYLPPTHPLTQLHACQPTYVSMQQSFSRSYQLLTHSGKSCILQNLLHNNVPNSLPLAHIQSQINAVHAYVRSISILCSHLHLGLQSSLFPSVSPLKPVYSSVLLPICAACPTYLILLNVITWITLDDEHKSWSTSSYNFLQSPVTSFLLGQNIFLTPYNTVRQCFPLNHRGQVSHLHKVMF